MFYGVGQGIEFTRRCAVVAAVIILEVLSWGELRQIIVSCLLSLYLIAVDVIGAKRYLIVCGRARVCTCLCVCVCVCVEGGGGGGGGSVRARAQLLSFT